MKNKIIFLLSCMFMIQNWATAQGLEGIMVEKYYQANAADAQYTVTQGYSVPLPQGAVTYRIFVDMAPGYKFVQMFGTSTQNLNFTTSTFFYNDENYDSQTGPTTSVINTKKHTAMIDSWLTTGGVAGSAASGKVGVPKVEDTDASIATGASGNTNNILFNALGGCFGTMITTPSGKDGLLPSSSTTYVSPNVLGMSGGVLDALTAGNSLGVINVTNGSIAALGGVVGATSNNRVLVGQFTTDGTFTFAINVQLLNPSGAAENYVHSNVGAGQLTHPTLIRTASSPSVSIVSDAAGNQICNGGSVTFTATPSNAGIPAFQWKVNGVNVGTNSNTFSSSSLTNGSIVTCVVTPDCGATSNTAVTSNSITMSVVSATNYYADTDGDGFGAGTAINSCANPGVGYVTNNTDCNDANAQVNTSATEICNQIDDDCDSQVDEGLSVTPSVSIVSSDADNSICSGSSVTFTATPSNGGTAPAYQWKVNGVNAGTNASTFTTTTLTNNAAVTVVMTANNACQTTSTANSNSISTAVINSVTPAVSIVSNDADNSICSGSSVTFTATPTNGGSTPAYQWKVNGVNAGTNAPAFTTTTLTNNAAVTVVMTSNNVCQTASTANANNIMMSVLNNTTYYADSDGDGFGGSASLTTCTNPGIGYVLNNSDCNDAASSINTAASEICDNLDNNCDGEIDEFVLVEYYADLDGDGFGDINSTSYSCSPAAGFVTNSEDCDDNALTYQDNDGDGFGSEQLVSCGSLLNTDCNDNNPASNPSASETCDAIDNDCDNEIDEFVQNTYYSDQDNDGFGNLNNFIFACELVDGFVTNADDCDDSIVTFEDLDGDGFGSATMVSCGVDNHDDCNDGDSSINPNATEICDNGVDENCESSDDACVIVGCTDPSAFNYNQFANAEDGSCVPVVLGCINQLSLNFNPSANTDDGSCIPIVEGCTDVNAFNYDPMANTEDGSCVPVIFGCIDLTAINYNVVANTDDGSCIAAVYGCTDPTAFNYDATANTNDGSCIAAVLGCTDPTAFNYNATANINDGSCIAVVLGCTDPTAFNYNATANTNNGSCIAVVLGCTDPTAFNYNAAANTNDGSCVAVILGCTDPTAFNYNASANTNDGSCNSVVFGCIDVTACNYDAAANADNGTCIYPQSEICNGLDDNCNGEIDEFVQNTYYADFDLDGFGDLNNVVFACDLPQGFVTDNSDCDDAVLTFIDADGDGFGGTELSSCGVVLDGDCDDLDAMVNPLSNEICGNSIDEDCNGIIESCVNFGCTDSTACNYDATATIDDFSCILPSTEVCNLIDDNCNGEIDEFVQSTFYADQDGDGFGNLNNATFACSQPNGFVDNFFDCDDNAILYVDSDGDGYGSGIMDACGALNSGDCLDFDDTVYPGAVELCDGFDQNCDGVVDENLLITYYADLDNDGFGDANNSVNSCSQDPGYVTDNSDCDDTQLLYVDADQDGYGTNVAAACGAPNTTDCNDTNAAVNPGATEIPNNAVDEDCDGQAVDVEQLNITQLSVFPVPAMNQFQVNGLGSFKNQDLIVLDAQGRRVLVQFITQDIEKFDCSTWADGMYTLHIAGESGSVQIIVTH